MNSISGTAFRSWVTGLATVLILAVSASVATLGELVNFGVHGFLILKDAFRNWLSFEAILV